jgi:hypothetical protein
LFNIHRNVVSSPKTPKTNKWTPKST